VGAEYAKILWGWPNKFHGRIEGIDTRVILVADDDGGSEGFDSEADFDRLPSYYFGGIWTNWIDRVAIILKNNGLVKVYKKRG